MPKDSGSGDPQPSGRRARGRAHRGVERVELFQQRLHPLAIGLADLGRRQRAGRALEQLRAEIGLEPRDELGGLAGADPEPARGGGEAAGLEHRDEHPVAIAPLHASRFPFRRAAPISRRSRRRANCSLPRRRPRGQCRRPNRERSLSAWRAKPTTTSSPTRCISIASRGRASSRSQPTKPLGNQRDLALAYSPGVAFACEAIAADPAEAANLTIRQNLVAVLTNGTAVLGLGAIGPLAAKPVMEGKAVLFKKFAGIDVFDIEVAQTDVDKLVDIIVALEPTFGGINLEDIKGPECFEVEEKAKARMGIPVFHDDQHGTAIIVSAAVTNALELTGKRIEEVRIVASGAGAAALASLNLLVLLGARRENVFVCDLEGVVYAGRTRLMDRWKAVYAQETPARTLAEVIEGADIFLGLSAGGVLKPELLKRMARDPLILALANPTPEIMPELAIAERPDAMICTGRSDYPNQVNNVLCFPYIFRGALDVGATTINEAMKAAAVKAIAGLAREAPSEVVARAYGGEAAPFGRASLIPSPFDPRLMLRIAPAVAKSGDGHAASRAGRSPISTPMPTSSAASCSVPASS